MRKWIVFAIPIALVILAALALVIHKHREIASLAKPRPTVPSVQTAIVAHGTLQVTTHYMGSVESYTQAVLAARISGNILSIEKREGDTVGAGEVVAAIDDRELAARDAAANAEVSATRQKLAGAQSAHQTQKSIYARDETLFAAGAISREALERSQSALDAAKAIVDAYEESIKGLTMNAEAAHTQAGYARIKAPFAGIVTGRWMEPGDMAIPGKPILTIEKESSYKVTAQVPQEELEGIKVGGTARLSHGDQTMDATINRVFPALGRNLLGSVEMILPAPPFGLPSGSTIGVDLVRKRVTGEIVPENALMRTTAGDFVCVIQDGAVHVRKVTVLGTENGRATVEGDLSIGQQVAVGQENRLLTLVDGSPIQTGEEVE